MLRITWQRHTYSRTVAIIVGHFDVSAMGIDYRFCQRQTNSRSRKPILVDMQTLQGLENPLDMLARNADAIIAYRYLH